VLFASFSCDDTFTNLLKKSKEGRRNPMPAKKHLRGVSAKEQRSTRYGKRAEK
jgi:hypothetical protein